MSKVYGPDVSDFQGHVDWHAVRASGASFAIAKATEGKGYVASTFAANWAGIKAAGLIRGAYHFGHPNNDPNVEADKFAKTVGPVGAGDFLALDIEKSDNTSPAHVAAWCKAFLDRVAAKTGLPATRLLVYTGAWFWNPQAGGSHLLANHPLWLSGYTTGEPPAAQGFGHWTLWQYTDRQVFGGIAHPCDASVFNGSLAQLQALVGIVTRPPVVKPVTPPVAKPPVAKPPVVKPPVVKPPVVATKQLLPTYPGSAGFTLGAHSAAVIAVRRALQLPPEGTVDNSLRARVKKFQRIRPWLWPADGIVGPRTYRSLMNTPTIKRLYR